MKVKDLLEEYSSHFHTIKEDQTVEEALKQMSGYNISALVVITRQASQGIFTERDLVRCHILFRGALDAGHVPIFVLPILSGFKTKRM